MQRYLSSPGGGAARGEANAAPQRRSASGQWRVLRGLAPYVWPADRPDLQATVLVSLLLMLLAKIVTVTMPFAFKWATDALVAMAGGNLPPGQTWAWLAAAPVLATLLYGLTRVAMSLLVQLREGMFAKVALHAVRKLAFRTFEHMHQLSLRFHLERKTGGLTRVLERGRTG
ncbi:MAG TPA: ABC transporter transmembrane domain-containing protein, partial [Hyphomicrobiaceae bacterium]|nr:ABC transporter transmembrane domain-containing protein [Hyphomicrobiaceae bacterium]